MKRLIALVAVVLCLVHVAGAHELTFSKVDIRIDAATTKIDVGLPIVGLLQEEPNALPPGTTEADLKADTLSTGIKAALSSLVEDRLSLSMGGADLPLTVEATRNDGEDVAISLSGRAATGGLDVTADLFPGDTLHKVFVDLYRGDDLAGQYVLDTTAPTFSIVAPEQPLLEVVTTFVLQGIHHIFIGPDHIVFVLALLLLGGSLWSQLKIVTAFTAAHSITLTLATLNVIALPSQLVESVIALSIVVVGLHDLWQLQRSGDQAVRRDWRIVFAFGFGLIHGFGFASVLSELDLPQGALAWSLAAFNVGVEIGQATIVLVAAPLIALLRRYAPSMLARVVLSFGAFCVIAIGTIWLIERQFGL